MCFGGGGGGPGPQDSPPPIKQRNPDLTRASRLPEKRKLVEEDDIATVEYGSSKKRGGAASGKKVGAAGLRIPLNTGSTAGAGTGGANV